MSYSCRTSLRMIMGNIFQCKSGQYMTSFIKAAMPGSCNEINLDPQPLFCSIRGRHTSEQSRIFFFYLNPLNSKYPSTLKCTSFR